MSTDRQFSYLATTVFICPQFNVSNLNLLSDIISISLLCIQNQISDIKKLVQIYNYLKMILQLAKNDRINECSRLLIPDLSDC